MSTANAALASGMGRGHWAPLLQLSAQEVFDLMLGCPLTTPAGPQPEKELDVTGMVGLAGTLRGVITVRCSVKSAALMAARLLGTEPDEACSDMWDAIGEICNMVAGNFKNKVSGLSDGCLLSVPTVITGGEYSLHALSGGSSLHLTMGFEGEPVLITLEVHS